MGLDSPPGEGTRLGPMSVAATSELLTIGAFATRSRLSQKALRLYAELGLLRPIRVDPDSGYRLYGADQVDRARLIGLLRRLDMPLARIADVLDLEGSDAARAVAAFWAEAEASVAVKRRLASYLERHLSGRGEPMYDVATRDVPAQDVISVTRSLHVKDLERFIVDTTRDLIHRVEAAGAAVGPACFVVYHGEVNDDSDGPVEVCVPFRGEVDAPEGAAVRAEPEHREAFTTITLAQCEFPGILDAYAAVEGWIEREGRHIDGAPREVYFNQEAEPEPDRPFCDVAFPIR
jgi:DNA-binding transcriptional MerR regulator